MLVDFGHAVVALCQEPPERRAVFVGLADRLLENRRVGGDALEPVTIDQGLQFAARDEAVAQIVEPRRLPATFELLQVVHAVFLASAIWCSAASSTRSGVKPNFRSRSLSGAEEPKVCMPILAPVLPTERSQPSTDPSSTETRAPTCGGRPHCRYASSASARRSPR